MHTAMKLLEANRLRIELQDVNEFIDPHLVVTVDCACDDDHHDVDRLGIYWPWHPPIEVRTAILAEWCLAMRVNREAAYQMDSNARNAALPELERMAMVARLVAVLAAPPRCPACREIAEHDAKAVQQ